MSDNTNQINWLTAIVIAVVLAAPGWYLYYAATTKAEKKEKRGLYKTQRLEKQLDAARKKVVVDRAGWRQRFQDANQALIAANTQLQAVKSETVTVREAISNIEATQADSIKQLEASTVSNAKLTVELKEKDARVEGLIKELVSAQDELKKSHANYEALQKQIEIINNSKSELSIKLEERDSKIEALTNELSLEYDELKKAQEQFEIVQKKNLEAKSKIDQHSAVLDEVLNQAETYKKQNLQQQGKHKQLSEEHGRLKLEFEQLKRGLSQEIKKKEIEILTLTDDSAVIRLQNNILFDSATAQLKKESKPALDRIAIALQEFPDRKISIEGHTDALQIIGEGEWHFISNWELSAARAAAAARYLLYSNSQLDATKIQIVGHGAYSPIADNATPEGRRLNRRIEIRILLKERGEEVLLE